MSTIYFTPHAMARLNAYIDYCDGEVSLLGRVERLNSDFLVTEVHLLEQETTMASTELDSEAIARFLTELVEKGEDPSTYKLWVHSHVDFEVFWSATDEATCRRFQNKWMLSMVANRRRDYLGRIDVYEPIHLSAELPVRVYTQLQDEEIEEIKEEIKQKVKHRTWNFYSSELNYGRWWIDKEEEELQKSRSARGEDPQQWTF